jgi:hypothetical protein
VPHRRRQTILLERDECDAAGSHGHALRDVHHDRRTLGGIREDSVDTGSPSNHERSNRRRHRSRGDKPRERRRNSDEQQRWAEQKPEWLVRGSGRDAPQRTERRSKRTDVQPASPAARRGLGRNERLASDFDQFRLSQSAPRRLLVADPSDLASFGNAVETLLRDRTEAGRLGTNARARAGAEFLGDRHLEQYGRLLAQLG